MKEDPWWGAASTLEAEIVDRWAWILEKEMLEGRRIYLPRHIILRGLYYKKLDIIQ